MARFGHEDKQLTIEYRKSGRFQSRGSKVLVRWDGSLRIVLQGIDKTNLRLECFTRDNYTCVDRNDGHTCHGPLQMSHDPAMGKSGGSDVLEQVFCRCWRAHVKLDHKNCPAHF